jgi:hypothetical protein
MSTGVRPTENRAYNGTGLGTAKFQKAFVITTDASTTGIVYILGQRDDEGRDHPI